MLALLFTILLQMGKLRLREITRLPNTTHIRSQGIKLV